jgi:hypothetical protein
MQMMIPLESEFCLASSALIVSSTVGFLANHMNVLGGNAGTILSLGIAAFCSNVGMISFQSGSIGTCIVGLQPIPSTHFLYDLCWTKFLPASLALTLLSSPQRMSIKRNDTKDSSSSTSTQNVISAVSIPFIIGSLGSILGCLVSAFVFGGIGGSSSNSAPNQARIRNAIGMNPAQASIAAGRYSPCITKRQSDLVLVPHHVHYPYCQSLFFKGCLCASYIGGSANFFATARILSAQVESMFPKNVLASSTNSFHDLFGAMAAADLLIMALYFGGLSALLSSKTLKRLFPGREMRSSNEKGNELEEETASFHRIDSIGGGSRIDRGGSVSLILSGIVATCMIWGVVELSIAFENITSRFIPGMGCGAIAIITMGINRVMNLMAQNNALSNRLGWFLRVAERFDEVSTPMSVFCFQLLFAAIGVSANIQSVVRSGLSSLVFAALALIIHMATVLFGSLVTMKFLKQNRRFRGILPLSLEEVLVASNAAIGGSATAAAFAGNIISRKDGDKTKKEGGLVLAATIWGVVGYSVATTIGVFLSNQLVSTPSLF